MIVWYRNSILASIVSIIGCLGIVAGVGDLMRDESIRELGVPTAIGMIVGGLVLAVLGKIISLNKAEKKAAKPAKPANTFVGKRVGASIILAAIFFLVAAAAGGWFCYEMNELISDYYMDPWIIAEYSAYAVLMIGAFWMRGSQSANVLQLLAFVLLACIFANNALDLYRVYGFESYFANDGSTYHALTLAPVIAAVSFGLMGLFSIFSMRRVKASMGIVVRILWLLPVAGIAAVMAKNIVDSGIYDYFRHFIEYGGTFHISTGHINALSQVSLALAVFFNAYAFQRCCKKAPAEAAPAYTAPAQTYTAPSYSAPAQTYTAPSYSAPAQTYSEPKGPFCPHCGKRNEVGAVFCQHCGGKIIIQAAQPAYEQPAQTVEVDVQTKLNALKDLLDCGIISKEEYDQKVRELRG